MNTPFFDSRASRNVSGVAKLNSDASLRIFGEHLDFDRIARNLGAPPTRVHRAGETLGGAGRPFTKDLWLIEAPLDRAETLDKHLLSLSQMLEPHYDFLRSLKGHEQLRSFCGIISDGDDCAFRLSPDALRIFTRLDIHMELSLIFLGLDTESPPSELGPNAPPSEECKSESQQYRTESRVSMEMTSDAFDLEEVCERLRFPIPESDRVADATHLVRPGGGGHRILTSPLPPTDKLDLHMKWLWEQLSPKVDILTSPKPRVEMLICCDFRTESDSGGVGISPGGLKVCTETGIPLDFHAGLV